jgi:hypothetical protein
LGGNPCPILIFLFGIEPEAIIYWGVPIGIPPIWFYCSPIYPCIAPGIIPPYPTEMGPYPIWPGPIWPGIIGIGPYPISPYPISPYPIGPYPIGP